MISTKASQRRWSQGVSPSEGTARARASRQARVSAKDSAGSWTRHGAERLVEAQVATIVLGAGRRWGGDGGERSSGPRRPARARCTRGPGHRARGRSRAWPRRPRRGPCRRTRPRHRATRPGGACPRPSRPDAHRPGRRRRDPEALGGPGLDRRRTLVPVRLAPVDLAHQHDDLPLGGGLLPEGQIELVDDLLVRQSTAAEITSAAMRGSGGLDHRGENGRRATGESPPIPI